MNKKVLAAVFTSLCVALGFVALSGAEVTGKGGPVITQSFASKEIRGGETWKVYMNASDLSDKMKYIYAEVQQPGGMGYPVSMTRIKPENRKELSGYIYLNTITAGSMDFGTLKLVVYLGDGAGNFSEPATFPLEFSPRAAQTSPPQGVFKENDLGPVMIQLRPVGIGGQSPISQ